MKLTPLFCILILTVSAFASRAQTITQLVDTPRSAGWSLANTGTSAFFGAASYPTHDSLFVGGQAFLRSTDEGTTWESVTGPAPLVAPYYVTGVYGYLVSTGDTIYRTTDAGHSWAVLHINMPPSFITDFTVVAPASLYAVAASWIARSTDSGATW